MLSNKQLDLIGRYIENHYKEDGIHTVNLNVIEVTKKDTDVGPYYKARFDYKNRRGKRVEGRVFFTACFDDDFVSDFEELGVGSL